jgi:hypothetical protein
MKYYVVYAAITLSNVRSVGYKAAACSAYHHTQIAMMLYICLALAHGHGVNVSMCQAPN